MNLPNNSSLQGGKYRIVRFISSGGFGCTYEAELVLLHKRIAIKEFFVKDFCDREENTSYVTVATQSKVKLIERLKKKFIEEASALFSMQHPNIVRVTDVFEENGTAYYVMDYIDGQSLQEIVKEKGALDESLAVGYIKQVADALKYVHNQNRLHLDIKPGNIMIDKNNQAILIDFGASKQYDEVEGENTSTLLGKTPGYAPLEQIGNEVVRFLPATDIYALGATLYKILTGKTPVSATLLASGESLEPISSTISESTQKAIYAAMEINKNKRPQDIDEFLNLLDRNRQIRNEITGRDVNKYDKTFLTDELSEKTLLAQEEDNYTDKEHYEYIKPATNNIRIDQIITPEKKSNHIFFKFVVSVVIIVSLFFIYNNIVDDPEEIYIEACDYLKKKDYSKAFDLYSKAAEKGLAEAQNNLGSMYQNGWGVTQDYEKAKELYTKAAEQELAEAQYNLGVMYKNGWGVTQNYEKAKELYTKAAEQELAEAQYNLGMMYECGEGVTQDYEKAKEWYTKAAEQGFAEAQYALGMIYEFSYGVTRDYQKAKIWYAKAAEQGHFLAKKRLE